MFYKINAGPLALDNGAVGPLSALFALAEAAGQRVISGRTYGDDYLRVPADEGERNAMEELLNELKLLWQTVPNLPHHLAGFA